MGVAAMNLVQIRDSKGKRRVGLVDGGSIVLLKKVATTLDLARLALKNGQKLATAATTLAGSETEDYARALRQKRVLTPVDHPDPAHCIITGTGLTHLGSAAARDGMHKKLSGATEELTDSLKMFKMGLEGGKPKSKSEAGVQPEWFYKGDGSWLVGPGQPLPMPSFALDGGEEPELAGLYYIRSASALLWATSTPTMSPSGRIISISPIPSCAIPPSGRKWCWARSPSRSKA
jgi:hypothetical protein